MIYQHVTRSRLWSKHLAQMFDKKIEILFLVNNMGHVTHVTIVIKYIFPCPSIQGPPNHYFHPSL